MFQDLSIRRVATLALLTGLVGCSSPPKSTTAPQTPNSSPASSANESGTSSANAPLVVATNTVVCGLTKQIAANTVNLKCLIDAGSDLHVYEPKPEDSKEIEQAKLIFYGGYDFEPTLIKLIKATSNPAPKIAVH
ncbi:MAG: zinc ABC transporter substrate-binding protein, partial [Phormidesmis sp. CAN_BIN44]|nr:zinc ABC transporter substrate-binding protein [Phormidesmis sp. CAN_BIN44]